MSGKIPLIVNIYGGPAAQMVLKTPPNGFDEILARKGFAIFAVDNRGTPGRDRKFQTAIRHEFGAIELKDQLTAVDQLLAQYPQLDSDRIGNLGMVEWRIDDAVRDDAFGALPRGSGRGSGDEPGELRLDLHRALHGAAEGRQRRLRDVGRNEISRQAARALLLVHGTSDDNVHFQNSIQMINALINAGKQFRLMIYPNKTHSIAGKDARVHLFTMIEEHFEKELK